MFQPYLDPKADKRNMDFLDYAGWTFLILGFLGLIFIGILIVDKERVPKTDYNQKLMEEIEHNQERIRALENACARNGIPVVRKFKPYKEEKEN